MQIKIAENHSFTENDLMKIDTSKHYNPYTLIEYLAKIDLPIVIMSYDEHTNIVEIDHAHSF